MRGVGVNTSSYVPPTPTGAAPTAVRYYEVFRGEFDSKSSVTKGSPADLDAVIETGVNFADRRELLKIDFPTGVDPVPDYDGYSQFVLNDTTGITTTTTTPIYIDYSYYIDDPEGQITPTLFDIEVRLGGYIPAGSNSDVVGTLQTNQWVTRSKVGSVPSGKDLNTLELYFPQLGFSSIGWNWSFYIHRLVVRYKL